MTKRLRATDGEPAPEQEGLPIEVWKHVVRFFDIRDIATVLSFIGVCKASFEIVQPNCLRLIRIATNFFPTNHNVTSTSLLYDWLTTTVNEIDLLGASTRLTLSAHITTVLPTRSYTRENVSFVLAVMCAIDRHTHGAENIGGYGCCSKKRMPSPIREDDPLKHIYTVVNNVVTSSITVTSLLDIVGITVCDVPLTPLPGATELQHFALKFAEPWYRTAVLYMMWQHELTPRTPNPEDRLRNVILPTGAHIFSDASKAFASTLFYSRDATVRDALSVLVHEVVSCVNDSLSSGRSKKSKVPLKPRKKKIDKYEAANRRYIAQQRKRGAVSSSSSGSSETTIDEEEESVVDSAEIEREESEEESSGSDCSRDINSEDTCDEDDVMLLAKAITAQDDSGGSDDDDSSFTGEDSSSSSSSSSSSQRDIKQ